MAAGEALRRLFQVRWAAVAACAFLGMFVGYGAHLTDHPVYSATAQVILDTPDPQGQTDSEAYADGARAIVTSPSHVAAALRAIHVTRNAALVAAKHVTLQPEGLSAVEQITVTDQNRYVAAALANALAKNLVETRLEIRASSVAQTKAQAALVASAINQVNSNLAQVDAQIQRVNAELPGAGANDVSGLAALASTLAAERTSMVQQQAALITQQNTLVQQQDSLIGVRNPTLIGPATPPADVTSSHLKLDIALGALLGLVLGLGVAALLETIWPTIAGPEGFARVAGAPYLGRLVVRADQPVATEPLLPLRLTRVASAAGLRRVELAYLGGEVDLDELAESLRPTTSRASSGSVPGGLHPLGPLASVAVDARLAEPATGIALITPAVMRRATVERVCEWARLTRRPVMGVIIQKRHGRARRRRAAVEDVDGQ